MSARRAHGGGLHHRADPVCTVRRHPEGGFAPVLHLSDQPPPDASPLELSMPTPDDVVRYARNDYGTVVVAVGEDSSNSGSR